MKILEKLETKRNKLKKNSASLLRYYIRYGNRVKERVREGLILSNLDLLKSYLWKDDDDLVSDLLLYLSTSVNRILEIAKSPRSIPGYLKLLKREFKIQALDLYEIKERPMVVSFDKVHETGYCPIENTKFVNDDKVSTVLKSIESNNYVSILQNLFKDMESVIYLPIDLSNKTKVRERFRRIGLEDPVRRDKTLVILVVPKSIIKFSATDYEGFKSFLMRVDKVGDMPSFVNLYGDQENSKFLWRLEKNIL